MENKLDVLWFKIRVSIKSSLPLLIYVAIYSLFMFLRNGNSQGYKSMPVGFITAFLVMSFLHNRKYLDTFLRFGGSRIRYFKYRLSEATITSLIFISLFWIYYYFFMRENIDFSVMMKIGIYYFVYILLCLSTKIFAEFVNKSGYLAIGYAMMFFYFILFVRYGIGVLISDIDTIMLNFNKVVIWELIIIIFNIGMSYISLETIEIH